MYILQKTHISGNGKNLAGIQIWQTGEKSAYLQIGARFAIIVLQDKNKDGGLVSMTKVEKHQEKHFFIFIAPWLAGLLIFSVYPIVASLWYSFTDYNVVNPSRFIGIKNYTDLMSDPIFWVSVKATLYYTLLSVPAGLVLSLFFAVLINQKVPLQKLFRTLMYLPSMVSGVATSLMWMWMFNPQIGMVNYILSLFGIQGPQWLMDENWAVPALIIMSFWSVGSGMIVFLAGLQGVPVMLYESAYLDGANGWTRFWKITFPIISPVFLFQLIMNLIASFQVFTQAFVMTEGGPHYATTFYVYYLYLNAFRRFSMGYASAMSWILLVVVLTITYWIMKTSDRFVYYEGGKK